MKKIILLSLLVFVSMTLSAQERRELHILSINDPHAAIEQFPRLGYVADSLRTLYPGLQLRMPGVPDDHAELPPRQGVHPRPHRRREGQGRRRGEEVKSVKCKM